MFYSNGSRATVIHSLRQNLKIEIQTEISLLKFEGGRRNWKKTRELGNDVREETLPSSHGSEDGS